VRRFVQLAVAAVAFGALIGSAAYAADAKGKEVFTTYKCQSCHSVKAQGIEKKSASTEAGAAPAAETSSSTKKKAPDLSGVGAERNAAWMTKWLLKTEKIDGALHKKKWNGTDDELKAVTDWLVTLKTDEKGGPVKAKAAAAEKAKPAEATEKAEPTEKTEGGK